MCTCSLHLKEHKDHMRTPQFVTCSFLFDNDQEKYKSFPQINVYHYDLTCIFVSYCMHN